MTTLPMFGDIDLSATIRCAACGYDNSVSISSGMYCLDVDACAERGGLKVPEIDTREMHKQRKTGAVSFHAPFNPAGERDTLVIERVSSRVADDTCKAFHYSGQCNGTNVSYGFWDEGVYHGIIAFLPPNVATPGVPRFFERLVNGDEGTGWELSRIALSPQAERRYPTTRYMSMACALVAQDFPGISVLFSYADSAQGHEGTVYKAASWIQIDGGGSKSVWMNGRAVLVTLAAATRARWMLCALRAGTKFNCQTSIVLSSR